MLGEKLLYIEKGSEITSPYSCHTRDKDNVTLVCIHTNIMWLLCAHTHKHKATLVTSKYNLRRPNKTWQCSCTHKENSCDFHIRLVHDISWLLWHRYRHLVTVSMHTERCTTIDKLANETEHVYIILNMHIETEHIISYHIETLKHTRSNIEHRPQPHIP